MEMTVLRALELRKAKVAELATALTENVQYVASAKKDATKLTKSNRVISIEEFEKAAKAHFDKVTTLTNVVTELSLAINKSNSTTIVTLDNKQVTIDKVLIFKKYGFTSLLTLRNNMRQQSAAVTQEFNRETHNYENVLSTERNNIIATTTDPDMLKQKLEGVVLSNVGNSPVLIDPLSINERIDSMSATLIAYETEINCILVESNAITKINVNI